MARDANIPIFLWVATAALVHILFRGGAEEAVSIIESRENVRRFAASVKRHVSQQNQAFEVALLDDSSEWDEPTPDRDTTDGPQEEPEESKEDEDALNEDNQKAKEEEPPRDTRAEPVPPPPQPKPDAKVEKKEEQPAVVIPMHEKPRIAVQQQVTDPNQKDNPDADFMADHANHVKQQTQARITSSEQNSPAPNPGSNHSSSSEDPGNSHVTDVAQSDNSEGNPEEAPAESHKDGDDEEVAEASTTPRSGSLTGGEPARRSHGTDQDSRETETQKPSRGQKPETAQAEREAHPETLHGERGESSIGVAQDAAEARRAKEALRRRLPKPRARRSPDLRGFGSLNTTPGGLNPNLNQTMAMAAIGQDQLARERRADGERRRSKHRGSWKTVGLERWRSAIENYVASVQPGNQTALNTAHRGFATYLNRLHLRLHPVFADGFLGSLDSLPSDHALNRSDLKTFLEIVLSREDGRIVRMGVTRASGNTAFDVGALESVQRASPFGPPPSEIVSPDGNVYLHWEFHRNPIYACSTYFARPYLIRVAPTPASPPDLPTPPKEEPEGAPGGERHGWRTQEKRNAPQDG